LKEMITAEPTMLHRIACRMVKQAPRLRGACVSPRIRVLASYCLRILGVAPPVPSGCRQRPSQRHTGTRPTRPQGSDSLLRHAESSEALLFTIRTSARRKSLTRLRTAAALREGPGGSVLRNTPRSVYTAANAPSLPPVTPNAVQAKQMRNTKNKRTSLPPALFMSAKTRSNVKKALSNGGGAFSTLSTLRQLALESLYFVVRFMPALSTAFIS
jgi:hypothetical protein